MTLALALALVGVAAPVDYVRDVKPIFAENCCRCHGASQHKGGLRLDTAAFALKGGETGPAFKPGNSTGSLIVQAIKGIHQEIPRMPYKKRALSDAQIVMIEQWIDQGAQAPADEQPEKSKHWAFVPPERPAPPSVKRQAWVRNSIDAFILARLEKDGIAPSPEADRVTLIRRLSLDLLGLPPTPEELEEFLRDTRPDAYERWVDRLLASPHYGERWGRWWLDAARYADSNGYSIDAPRQIWKYRDWVIDALNRDLPFDQFALWQLAGDLLPDATLEQKIATGFHRNTQINQEGGIDPEQFRVESVVDRVNTTATVFLGLTLACAQCHDHKFDPFTQREYYQMFAFFNNTVEDGHGKGTPGGVLEIPGEFEPLDNIQKQLDEIEQDLDRYLDTQGSALQQWEQALAPDASTKLKPEVRSALQVAARERSRKQKRIVYAAFKADDPEFKSRNAKLAKLERREPRPVTTLIMVEQPEPRETHLLIKGDFTRSGERVTPGMPASLQPLVAADVSRRDEPRSRRREEAHSEIRNPKSEIRNSESLLTSAATIQGLNARNFSGKSLPGGEGRGEGDPTLKHPVALNRLDLARWIVATNNPLTARVIVNRVWQQYFGRGIVETENDFGAQGIPPTHPELLDWLACEFVSPVESLNRSTVEAAAGSTIQRFHDSTSWSLKRLHRLIVTSATYRQSSNMRPDLRDLDPNNKLLARQSRLRLDAEVVRDVALAASGLLSHKMGGPPVFPPQPDGVMTLGQVKRDWKDSADDERYRRGIYTHFWRATPHPALTVFDAPDGFSTCTRRLRSNTPLQALTLLNDRQFYELARGLAARVLQDGPNSDMERLAYAFRLCVARNPDDAETRRLNDLLTQQISAVDGNADLKRTEGWTTVARVLLNLDETITRE